MRHGVYWRNVILEGAMIRIPVARYLCRRRGKAAPGAHRTFSLLPVQSHPFKRYSSEGSYAIFKESLVSSLTRTLDHLAEGFSNLCISTLLQIRSLFEEAGMRLKAFDYLDGSKATLTAQVISCLDGWYGGLPGCKTDFYVRHGMFLLGTPSQNR